MRKTQVLKVNHHLKNDVTVAEDTDTVLLNADKNSKTIKINHKTTKNQILSIHEKRFIVSMALENHYSSNHSRNHSPYNSNYRGRSPDSRNSRNSSQNRYSRSHSRETHYRNNYSRSNSNKQNYSFDTSSHSYPRIRHYSNDRSRNSSYSRHLIIPTIGTEIIQIIAINNITIDHEMIRTIDQITKDLIITIMKLDHEKIHNIGIETITINKETTLNHLIGITHVIQTLKTNIEVIHQNIRDNKKSTNN